MNSVNKTGIGKFLKLLLKIASGTAIGLVIALGLTFASAAIFWKSSGRPEMFLYLQYLFISLGAFVTGSAAFSRFKGRGVVTGLLGSIPYCLIIISLTLILGSYGNRIWILIPLILFFGAVGGIVGANSRR